MGVHMNKNMVDEVDVASAWDVLQANSRAQLVDVRSRAEWTYVGIPDLGPLGRQAVFMEWERFPDHAVDPHFAERLANELQARGVQMEDDLFFICRLGIRSLVAAQVMAASGYSACHNVTEGFEGALDEARHRGTRTGWKAIGLPWLQG